MSVWYIMGNWDYVLLRPCNRHSRSGLVRAGRALQSRLDFYLYRQQFPRGVQIAVLLSPGGGAP